MLSNSRRFTIAVRRALPANAISKRCISSSSQWRAFDGSKPGDHVTEKKDQGNVQHEASEQGQADRASGGDSGATSGRDQDNKNQKALKDHPEAPGVVIGMNDERGGKGR